MIYDMLSRRHYNLCTQYMYKELIISVIVCVTSTRCRKKTNAYLPNVLFRRGPVMPEG